MAGSQGNLDAQAHQQYISRDLGFLRLNFSLAERRCIRDNFKYKSNDRQQPWPADKWGSSPHSPTLSFLIGRMEKINITHFGDRENRIGYGPRAMGIYSIEKRILAV